ncbi:MAG: ZIP family metal transporter [Erysipelotrichaceae bacterium]|jgi:ZIP family zinc transporter|nr:ZIP family metal transporter [Lachnospiraceae bacterium]MCR5300419.1 ZIP family metal transporter [Erysipelotrichaceae bacterium]
MNTITNTAVGLLIPLLGTTLGSAMVYFMRGLDRRLEKILNGFASGVMIAASVWSLLIPALDMSASQGKTPWLAPSVGFLFGIFFLLLLDECIPHVHFLKSDRPEGPSSKLKKTTMMVLAVTLHNIPEGMAVGVTYAGALAAGSGISFAAATALSLGIAIQNFPEGAIISMPLEAEGLSKSRSFLYGMLSGVVEPVGALLTILLTGHVLKVLPYLLSFAAGAMIYVVIEELIPESQEGGHSNIATVAAAFGFVLMMILDVALG